MTGQSEVPRVFSLCNRCLYQRVLLLLEKLFLIRVIFAESDVEVFFEKFLRGFSLK